MIRPVLPYLGAVHALLAIVTLHAFIFPHGDVLFTLTLRRQFDNWRELIALYRNTTSYAPLGPNRTRTQLDVADALAFGEDMRDRMLGAAWCAEYLPRGTERAPYCRCVSRQHDTYLNASSSFVADGLDVPSAVREDAVRGLVSCLGARPVWRVWPFWATHVASPCLYVFVVVATFMWLASDLDEGVIGALVGILVLYSGVALFIANPARHCLWSISILLVGAIARWVVAPGLRPIPSGDGADQPLVNAPGDRAQMPRGSSCFWWGEYLCAPVFALYACVVHGGRDLIHVLVVLLLGGAVGGLGLRAFWCGNAYPDAGAKGQMRPILRKTVWLGILGASVALLSLCAIYYQRPLPVVLGDGSVAMLGATLLVSLLQFPGGDPGAALPLQCVISFARNIALFVLVFIDVRRMGDALASRV
jgi:hypothetical protein